MLALIRGRIVTLWSNQAKFFPRFLDSCVSALETAINAINALEIDGMKQLTTAINAINALEIDGMKQLMTCKTDGLWSFCMENRLPRAINAKKYRWTVAVNDL